MSIEKSKKISKAEVVNESLEKVFDRGKEFLHNVASHLPFANLAKKKSGDFHIEIDLAGVKKEDIDISIADHILTVTAERKMKKEVKESDYYILESNFGKIVRSFSIPDGIDTDKIDAEFKEGRLYITLEKEESLKPKAIKVK
jgi:HSP20 family protein